MSEKRKFKQIYLEITKNCNLNCPFCPSVSNRNQNITVSNFSTVIERTKEFTSDYYLHIMGEPLLYPNLDELFKVIEQNGRKVKITTNAILLFSKKDQLLSNNCLERINISVQSWKSLGDKLINQNIENLVNFIKIKNLVRPKLTISIRFWNDKENLKTVEFNNYVKEELSKSLDLNFFTKHPSPYLVVSEEDEFVWPSLENLENLENPTFTSCLGGKKQLAILLNGDVCLCCLDYQGNTKLGNIYQNTLAEILSSDIYQNWQLDYNNHNYHFELCKKCTFRDRF